jgi:NAD(P)-dependent dehydrogenase (short-subunit alcohol dehydrogenase family)
LAFNFLTRFLTRPTSRPRHAIRFSDLQSKPVRPHLWTKITYRFYAEHATWAQSSIEKRGTAIAISVDLVDRLAVEDALGRVAEELGAIDLVVNNHGCFRAFGPIWECDPDVWWQDVEINLRGTFNTCRVAAPAMLARGKGRIVNLVGGGTGNSFPHGSGYASSKAAIMRFTECHNDTTKDRGVLAFAVDPGLVRTSMTELQLYSDAGKTYMPN